MKKPICSSCNDTGMIGGYSGQTAESYQEHIEPCRDCEKNLARRRQALLERAREYDKKNFPNGLC
jgi:hypothetical protein